VGLLLCFFYANLTFASAYNARPKLVVIVVVDQFRGDYLDRYHDQFGEGGFKLFLDHGASFTDCNYNYATTVTAAGHATLLTGAYSNGHGILANEWWNPQKKRMVTSVWDDTTKLVGVADDGAGASPHNLLADTLGDELKLSTQGKARVFAISLKDRASILPGGFAANGAYWIDHKSGAWITSTYYRSELPKWIQDFNDSKRTEKYLNLEWKDASGNVLRTTKPDPTKPDFYGLVGSTPLASAYELEFARELITYEKLGSGPATDLLVISLSSVDILGHQVGPDSPEMQAMILATDRELTGFFDFLGRKIGLANVWLALSADHGVAPVAAVAAKLHIPAAGYSADKVKADLNRELSAKLPRGRKQEYVLDADYSFVWLNDEAFAALKIKEEDAEKMVGESLKKLGMRGYFTRSQLARADVPNTKLGQQFLNSYSLHGGWYVRPVPPPFFISSEKGTDHGSSYTYDTHVPLAFYGLPFQPGVYRTHAEPTDLAVTLASLLGINAPTHAVGRVLTESLAPAHRGEGPPPQTEHPTSPPISQVKPAVFSVQGDTR
jgi:predicted AlkP superfamily pyrophosphatase or phosphodiesterase